MSILDPKFKYVPALHTNIAETFRKARKELEKKKKRDEAIALEKVQKVRAMK